MSIVASFSSLSPLSNRARKSISALDKQPNSLRPAPRATSTAAPSSSPTSPPSPPQADDDSKESLSSVNPPLSLPSQPLQNVQQFLDWYARIEHHLERQNDNVYQSFNQTILNHRHAADHLLEDIEQCRGYLAEIDANYRHLQENSSALHDASETLLNQLSHINLVTDSISSKLDYFRQLDSATRFLNSPGHSIVLQDDFLDIIERLDVCLDFMNNHPHYHDSQVYTIRFQQRLTRAMTLIKIYFVSLFRQLTAQVDQRIASTPDISQTALDALLYHKFESISTTPNILITQLEKRAQRFPQEYDSLLNECLSGYFSARYHLLSAPVSHEISTMITTPPDLVAIVRTGCMYLVDVCKREAKLFASFFSLPHHESIERYLESLCDYLYDKLRPLILHEHKMETLAQLCTVMNALIALDNGVDLENNTEQHQHQQQVLVAYQFKQLIEPLLQDTQTRLIFRAQTIIQQDVQNYSPSPSDLDYPNRLKGARGLNLWTTEQQTESVYEFRLPDASVQEAWYPVLRKTMWVLSHLYGYVNDNIFRDFAGEAVHLCQRALLSAGWTLSSRPGHSALDGDLFIIRHLIILKELIRSVDLADVDATIDYSTVTDSLRGLLWQTSSLLGAGSLYNMASRTLSGTATSSTSNSPHPSSSASIKGKSTLVTSIMSPIDTSETMRDAKVDLDEALKESCQNLIREAATSIVAPLTAFVNNTNETGQHSSKASPTSRESVKEKNAGLSGPESAKVIYSSFFQDTSNSGSSSGNFGGESNLEKAFGDIMSKLGAWLDDPDGKTLGVLLPSIQEEVVDAYANFVEFVRKEYGSDLTSTFVSPSSINSKLSQLIRSGHRLIKS